MNLALYKIDIVCENKNKKKINGLLLTFYLPIHLFITLINLHMIEWSEIKLVPTASERATSIFPFLKYSRYVNKIVNSEI